MSLPGVTCETAAWLDGPAPCDSCWLADRCGSRLLACDAFAMYCNDVSETRWRLAPRAPSAALFEQVMFNGRSDRTRGPDKQPRRPRRSASNTHAPL